MWLTRMQYVVLCFDEFLHSDCFIVDFEVDVLWRNMGWVGKAG